MCEQELLGLSKTFTSSLIDNSYASAWAEKSRLLCHFAQALPPVTLADISHLKFSILLLQKLQHKTAGSDDKSRTPRAPSKQETFQGYLQ